LNDGAARKRRIGEGGRRQGLAYGLEQPLAHLDLIHAQPIIPRVRCVTSDGQRHRADDEVYASLQLAVALRDRLEAEVHLRAGAWGQESAVRILAHASVVRPTLLYTWRPWSGCVRPRRSRRRRAGF